VPCWDPSPYTQTRRLDKESHHETAVPADEPWIAMRGSWSPPVSNGRLVFGIQNAAATMLRSARFHYLPGPAGNAPHRRRDQPMAGASDPPERSM
jgi:hypothetical protein